MERDCLLDESSPLIQSPQSRPSVATVCRTSLDYSSLTRVPNTESNLELWDRRSSEGLTRGLTGCHVAQPTAGRSTGHGDAALADLDDVELLQPSTCPSEREYRSGHGSSQASQSRCGEVSEEGCDHEGGSLNKTKSLADSGAARDQQHPWRFPWPWWCCPWDCREEWRWVSSWDEWRWVYSRDGLKALALGQLMSLLLTATATCSALLAARGISIPTFQSLLNYLLLASVYGAILMHRKTPLTVPWRVLLLASFLDVEGNYFVVLAFRFTSLTRVTLLDCWAIPAAMLLAALCLSTRYHCSHVLGALLCTAGLAVLLLSDAASGSSKPPDSTAGGSSNATLGNALVILGATLYAASNVSVEYLAHRVETTELLAFIGCSGSLISITQLLLLEKEELQSLSFDGSTVLPMVVFSLALFAFYSLTPLMLRLGGAALFNLSLLTSDLWAVGVSAVVFNQPVEGIYFASLVVVSVGLVIFSLR
ncbi:hypothetical protein CLOM_g24168 [Closterium sp. NIES-68]|nr:hypothetical protein CLOM_g24168 [Closterium sp. NIES-68]GJP86589.1 hypothetical protein CLOP_g16594 [Closterium sp. NIES-67]